jgi:hypothetical protein
MPRSPVLRLVHGGLLVLLVAACLLAAAVFDTTVPPSTPSVQPRALTEGDVFHGTLPATKGATRFQTSEHSSW